MSKTYLSNPKSGSSLRGRGRGTGLQNQFASHSRGRGGSNSSFPQVQQPSHRQGFQSGSSSRGRGNSSFGLNRGRGSTMNRGRGRSMDNGFQNFQTSHRSRSPADNSVFEGLGASYSHPSQRSTNVPTRPSASDTVGGEGGSPSKQTEQQSYGYRKYEPNMRKRQQVNEMANRETREYERFKKENAMKYCSYVGTTGGGELSEEMVRRRQANAVRSQKVNKMLDQERRRADHYAAEQREIDIKRADARRKADQNALGGKPVRPEEIRRNREDFLRQLESGTR